MLGRFGLYDFLAVVIPGIFFLWALGTFLEVAALKEALPLAGGLAETSVLVVVGYITGLLLQGVSQLVTEQILLRAWGGFPSARFLLPEDERFSDEYKAQLSEAVRQRFGLTLDLKPSEESLAKRLKRNKEIFDRCHRSVDRDSDLPRTYNAQYGLFRALLTTFVLLGGASLVLVAIEWYALGRPDRVHTIFALTTSVAAVISYVRAQTRSNDFAKTVYDLFLVEASKPTK